MTRCEKHGYTYCCIHEDCIICCDLCKATKYSMLTEDEIKDAEAEDDTIKSLRWYR